MISYKSKSLCEQSEIYYYDFLHKESRRRVPESILDHIEQCLHCQKQVNQLKEVLSQAEGQVGSQEKQIRTAVTNILELHFAYIGKHVTCQTVRPFLPVLSDPALEIKIPTPITAHLDKCQQCANDLEAIQRLKLNHKQLCRLGQLLAEKPSEDTISCSQAQAGILAVVLMAFDKTNAEVLKHLCTCPDCREVLYQYRETVREELAEDQRVQKKFPCEAVSATDIFDYCFPYGIDPANDQYAKFRGSFTSHACGCPTCLSRMQQLHKTIYNIAERPESEVVTIYTIDESTKAQAADESDGLYSGFPIKVEVITRKDEVEAEPSATTINFTAALKRKLSRMNLKPLVKTSIAAAAIILIAVVLFFNTLTAKAVGIKTIYKAIERVKNVYILKSVPGKAEPVEQKWVSKTLNIYMEKAGKQLVLWDIPNEVRKSKHLETAITETTQLTGETLAGIERKMAGSFGLMPFYDISEIPADAEWSRVTDDTLAATARGIEVYDLVWDEKAYDGSLVFWKWQVFVGPKTNLPHRVEWYKKLASDEEFALETIMMVEYLGDSEIQAAIDSSF
jgi:hypothetical protein